MPVAPENLRIEAVAADAAPTLGNLFEHYLHDMAQWFDVDTGEDGAYRYPVRPFWDGGGTVYLAYAGRIPIGFAIVVAAAAEFPVERGSLDLKEFFVMRRYRRGGAGRTLATAVWDRHPGPWLVRVYRGNEPALPFWRGCVADYTGGNGQELEVEANGKLWSYFTFRSPSAIAPAGE